MQFNEMELSEEILKAINEIGYSEMTEIQEKSIPVLLSGADVIGRSNTGTGKTAAFGIPAVESISHDKSTGVQTLILCPTRELAVQACDEIKKFSKFMPWVKPAAVYGGASIEKQIAELKHGANLIAGTPGRVMDHIKRHTLKLNSLKTIVLDEADEMLNMGFREDIEEILQYVPEERQTVLFSATMPPEIMAITSKYQKNPQIIKTISKSRTVEAINQSYYEVPSSQKIDALHLLLMTYSPKSSMVFCNTKKMVDELTDALCIKGFRAAGLHGDMKQIQRTHVMNGFKSGKTNILVATDIAARGIDVSGVDAVFNYDLPQDNEYYIHRIGRTGRAGKSGNAYTLISGRKQLLDLKAIAKYTKSEITKKYIPSKAEAIALKVHQLADKISLSCAQETIAETEQIISILESQGLTARQIAGALINKKLAKEIRSVPEVSNITSEYRNRESHGSKNGKTVKVNINVGRMQKIAPNFILGALVEATGMSGKSFGKIDIHDKYTTVEVPGNEIDHVIHSLNNGKINGNKVTVKKYEGVRRSSYRQSDKRNNSTYRKNTGNSRRNNKSYKKRG